MTILRYHFLKDGEVWEAMYHEEIDEMGNLQTFKIYNSEQRCFCENRYELLEKLKDIKLAKEMRE